MVFNSGSPILTGLHDVAPAQQWQEWQKLGFDTHSQIADLRFIDPARDDFRLRSDSPAFKLGFAPIPLDKIGPYKSTFCASWPIQEAPGAREKPPLATSQ